jgi:hypothetical protein
MYYFQTNRSLRRTSLSWCSLAYQIFRVKNTMTQGCNQGMRPNAAKCGYNSKTKSYTQPGKSWKGHSIFINYRGLVT